MRFSDGMTFNTETKKLRTVEKSDGWYVVGRGMLIPVSTREEGRELIKEMKRERV